ncbi:MAG: helix-turn-helix transcriptional regulator [Actinomycetia bacterium]|nr:helix-turn-helix transcriptional regulator [Actinomycetes bacterium]
MHRDKELAASEAARMLGISLDTLRRWDREGKITTRRDPANRRLVPRSEVDRLRAERGPERLSARNRLAGTVREVRIEGLLAQVVLDVTEPATVVAIITRDAAEALELGPGADATAIVKATSVMIDR